MSEISKAEQVARLRVARAERAEAARKSRAHAPKRSEARLVAKKAKPRQKGRAGRSRAHAVGIKVVRPGSKLEKIAKLLQRPEGCTAAEILKVCGWPAVSVPQQARALGIKLRSEREGRALRYWAA